MPNKTRYSLHRALYRYKPVQAMTGPLLANDLINNRLPPLPILNLLLALSLLPSSRSLIPFPCFETSPRIVCLASFVLGHTREHVAHRRNTFLILQAACRC